MKTWIKTLIISSSIIGVSAAVIAPVTIYATNLVKKDNSLTQIDINNEKILDMQKVANNFKSGPWQNKLFLNQEDFKYYDQITYDAFDGSFLPRLQYIDLPDHINIIYNSSKSLNWENISEIRVNKNNKNIVISNNILFIKNVNQNLFFASTIADRTSRFNQDLYFPCFQTSNPNFSSVDFKYAIANNFYNERIFKNVKKIRFYSDINNLNYKNPTTFYNISSIGHYAFQNCNKLDSLINFVNSGNISFGTNAFFNTSISEFNFICANNNDLEKQIINFAFTTFYSKNFNKLRMINYSNSQYDLILGNNYSFITSSLDFSFDLFWKTGDVLLCNKNLMFLKQDTNNTINYNRLFYYVPIDQVDTSQSKYHPLPFNKFDLNIFVNEQCNFYTFSIYNWLAITLLHDAYNNNKIYDLNFFKLVFYIIDQYVAKSTKNILFFDAICSNLNNFKVKTNYKKEIFFQEQFNPICYSQIKYDNWEW